MKRYDIVMLGHISKDILIYGKKTERSLGGAVVYSSMAAKKSGATVLVVTKYSSKDDALMNPIRENGIEVIALNSPETTSLENVYFSEDRERRKVRLISRANSIRVEELPDVSTRIYHLAGLFYGEIQSEIVSEIEGRAEIALDVQGVLRHSAGGDLLYRDWENKTSCLPKIKYLKTDAAEAEILTGETDREKAALILKNLGAGEVMITHNTELMVYDGQKIHRAPFTSANLSGRTGRGDTCFASYLAWRLSHDIPESVRYAAALTSIKMESPGVFKGDVDDVLARM